MASAKKRKSNDDDPPIPPPSVWVVTVTRFVDDWQIGDGDWSETIAKQAYTTEHKARESLRKWLIDRFNRELTPSVRDKLPKEVRDTIGDGNVQYDHVTDLEEVEGLFDEVNNGAYVPRLLGWEITECTLDEPDL